MYKIQIQTQDPIDAGWFERLSAILAGSREVFLALEPSAAKLASQRQLFADATPGAFQPDLTPDSVDESGLREVIKQLTVLLRKIDAEPNAGIRDAYRARIEEAIDENKLVLGAVRQDAKSYKVKNNELYGQPDPALFAACLAWIRGEALASLENASGLESEYAARVLELVPDLGGDAGILFPEPGTFQFIRNQHFADGGYIEQLFTPDGLPKSPYIEQVIGDEICLAAIRNIGADYKIASSEDGIWAVRNSVSQVVRPPGYRLERDEFAGIVCHEIGSHLLERSNGLRQPLRLLALGLDRFEAGNEGRAFLREQIMYETPEMSARQASWEYIVMLFVGVCLGSGMHGAAYRFSELHELLRALHAFWRERRYPLASSNDLAVREEAWQLTVRIMKGTNGRDPMGCYVKDIVYLQGNVACWRMAAVNPDIILFGDCGKFDIANPRHLQILRTLGLLTV